MKRIAYVSSVYPLPSETFVWQEVIHLRQRGWSVLTVGLRHAKKSSEALTQKAGEADHVVYAMLGLPLALKALVAALRRPCHFWNYAKTVISEAQSPHCEENIETKLKIGIQAWLAIGLSATLTKQKVTHIHCHFAHAPATFGMYAAKYSGLPFSFTGHANDLFERQILLREKLERAAFVSSISHWHQAFYQSVCDRPKADYPVIRCGVDLKQFRMREQGRVQSQKIEILVVARLVAKKGIDILLESLALLENQKAVKLHIAGDGPENEKLRKLANELGISSLIEWHGEVSHEKVLELLKQADLFVLPCRVDQNGDQDGIPVVLMEAMACGVPVISSRVGAIHELIESNVEGIMLDHASPEALAECLQNRIQEPMVWKSYSEAAQMKITAEFNLEKSVSLLEMHFNGTSNESIGKGHLTGLEV